MEEFLTNKDLLEIWKSYDAFYIENKYGTNTHKEEFERLQKLLKDDEYSLQRLDFMLNNYDSYYKNEFDIKNNDNPFYYLQCKLNDLEK